MLLSFSILKPKALVCDLVIICVEFWSTHIVKAPPCGNKLMCSSRRHYPQQIFTLWHLIKGFFSSLHFCRHGGAWTSAHLQQDRPLWHFDPVCASCRPHSGDADRPHRPVPCECVTHSSPTISVENHISFLHLCWTVCLRLQVRRAIQQMLFPTKAFNWLRHIAIALILLTFINMLVIFAPNILGIFGIIGKSSAVSSFHPHPNVKTH